jgi:hypothetical protein
MDPKLTARHKSKEDDNMLVFDEAKKSDDMAYYDWFGMHDEVDSLHV